MKKVLTAIGLGVGAVLLFALSKSKIFYGNLTDDELAEERERVRLRHCDGFDEYDTLRTIDAEINARSNAKYEDDPKRNTDPNYRWTDANRWDKD